MTIRLVNHGASPVFVEGSYRCGQALQLWRGSTRIKLPSIVDCMCSSCNAQQCLGIVDPPLAWIEIPAGAALELKWHGREYRTEKMPSHCSAGTRCWSPSPAPSGTYEVRVKYGQWGKPSEQLSCPDSSKPTVTSFQGEARYAECAYIDVHCKVLKLDHQKSVELQWPGDANKVVEIAWP